MIADMMTNKKIKAQLKNCLLDVGNRIYIIILFFVLK